VAVVERLEAISLQAAEAAIHAITQHLVKGSVRLLHDGVATRSIFRRASSRALQGS
jgi:hypothetical protein